MQNVRSRLGQEDERLSPEMVRGGPAIDGTDQIFSLLSHAKQTHTKQTGWEPHRREPDAEHDWSSPLDLLYQAAEAIRANAVQTDKQEARARALWARATEEIARAQARIEELEARLQASDARANAAEAQAEETREWARRLHDALAAELSAGTRLLHI